ncbi:MAG: hypothetical protein ACREEE_04730 [Dongiaceae bacterium]
MRNIIRLVVAAGVLVGGCSTAPKIEPLTIRQGPPNQQQAVVPGLTVIGGRLAFSRDGESRLPYESGTDGGCVAAATAVFLVILLPLAVLTGAPHLGPGPDCESYLPRLVLVQLESRRAAAVQVAPDGGFIAQVPPGTYLVTYVIDDKTPIPANLAFQVPEPGRAYHLGNLTIDYKTGWRRVDVTNLQVTNDGWTDFEKRTGELVRPTPLWLETRRQRIEAKWGAEIAVTRQRLCQGYLAGLSQCKSALAAAEAERDAELNALEADRKLALGQARINTAADASVAAAEPASAPVAALMFRLVGGAATTAVEQLHDEASWNSYLNSVIAELQGKDIRLLTEQPDAGTGPARDEVEASFAARRKTIETKWAAEIAVTRQRLCQGYLARRPQCKNALVAAKAERDAELKALDEARAKAVERASTVTAMPVSAPPAARIDRQLQMRGPNACKIVGRPASEDEYKALRQDLDECWQARVAVAQGLCDKSLGAPVPPCHTAEEAKKYRDAALAAFDADSKQRMII